jgi:hypothetical protein
VHRLVRVGVVLSDVHGAFDHSVFDGLSRQGVEGSGGAKSSEVNQGEQKI